MQRPLRGYSSHFRNIARDFGGWGRRARRHAAADMLKELRRYRAFLAHRSGGCARNGNCDIRSGRSGLYATPRE